VPPLSVSSYCDMPWDDRDGFEAGAEDALYAWRMNERTNGGLTACRHAAFG
jgi:hypothetical protein